MASIHLVFVSLLLIPFCSSMPIQSTESPITETFAITEIDSTDSSSIDSQIFGSKTLISPAKSISETSVSTDSVPILSLSSEAALSEPTSFNIGESQSNETSSIVTEPSLALGNELPATQTIEQVITIAVSIESDLSSSTLSVVSVPEELSTVSLFSISSQRVDNPQIETTLEAKPTTESSLELSTSTIAAEISSSNTVLPNETVSASEKSEVTDNSAQLQMDNAHDEKVVATIQQLRDASSTVSSLIGSTLTDTLAQTSQEESDQIKSISSRSGEQTTTPSAVELEGAQSLPGSLAKSLVDIQNSTESATEFKTEVATKIGEELKSTTAPYLEFSTAMNFQNDSQQLNAQNESQVIASIISPTIKMDGSNSEPFGSTVSIDPQIEITTILIDTSEATSGSAVKEGQSSATTTDQQEVQTISTRSEFNDDVEVSALHNSSDNFIHGAAALTATESAQTETITDPQTSPSVESEGDAISKEPKSNVMTHSQEPGDSQVATPKSLSTASVVRSNANATTTSMTLVSLMIAFFLIIKS